MLTIPSTLLSKLNSRRQTIGNNANPQMDIIAQKAAKYLNQGSFLTPKTIRTGNSLGPLDICIRREDPNAEPTEIVMLYIENDMAKVATLPYVSRPDEVFVYQYTVGPATEVACDFDGSWYRITDRTGIYFDTTSIWSLVTFGEPYFALINNGQLTIQQGLGINTVLATENITKCSMIRGWKSITSFDIDQGILVVYLKNGLLYYRNYCGQEDLTTIWEIETNITAFDSIGVTYPILNVGLFRTNDYRVGILIEDNTNTIYCLITDRVFSGMMVPPETLIGSFGRVSDIVMIDMEYIDVNHANEYLNGYHGISAISFGSGTYTPGAVVEAKITGELELTIIFNYPLVCNIDRIKDFLIVSNESLTVYYSIVSSQIGANNKEVKLVLSTAIDTENNVQIVYAGVDYIFVRPEQSAMVAVSGFTIIAPSLTPDPITNINLTGKYATLNIALTEIFYDSLFPTHEHLTGKFNGLIQVVYTKVGGGDI